MEWCELSKVIVIVVNSVNSIVIPIVCAAANFPPNSSLGAFPLMDGSLRSIGRKAGEEEVLLLWWWR